MLVIKRSSPTAARLKGSNVTSLKLMRFLKRFEVIMLILIATRVIAFLVILNLFKSWVP